MEVNSAKHDTLTSMRTVYVKTLLVVVFVTLFSGCASFGHQECADISGRYSAIASANYSLPKILYPGTLDANNYDSGARVLIRTDSSGDLLVHAANQDFILHRGEDFECRNDEIYLTKEDKDHFSIGIIRESYTRTYRLKKEQDASLTASIDSSTFSVVMGVIPVYKTSNRTVNWSAKP